MAVKNEKKAWKVLHGSKWPKTWMDDFLKNDKLCPIKNIARDEISTSMLGVNSEI